MPSTHRYGDFSCDVATTVADLEPHLAAWEDLQSRALEDNFYLSPTTFLSTVRNFAVRRFYVVFVYKHEGQGRRLVGCAPFSLLPRTVRTVTHVLSTFVGPHTYLSHPLFDRDVAKAALSALWEWVEAPGQPWRLVRLQHMSPSSPTWSLFRDELTRRGRTHWVKAHFSRARLKRHASFEAFLSTLSSNRRKNLRQRRRRLEKLGNVKVEVHRSLRNAPDLARRFMDLEARSWKGDHGSALSQAPNNSAFFTEITQAADEKRRLFFVELKVGDQPAAMAANFTLGRTMFAFKIAYDPAFQAYSPGILAELETVKAFHDDPNLQIADGGNYGSSHLDEYWQELHEMQDVYTSTGHLRSELLFRSMVGLTHAKRRATKLLGALRR